MWQYSSLALMCAMFRHTIYGVFAASVQKDTAGEGTAHLGVRILFLEFFWMGIN